MHVNRMFPILISRDDQLHVALVARTRLAVTFWKFLSDSRRMLPEIENEPRLGVVPSASQLMTRTKSLAKREIHHAL